MKGVSDDQITLNHLNAVLQSLYHLCPLRKAVFEPESNAGNFDVATLKNNPLELIFAKMYHDFEKRSGATDASIYFKDTYLKDSENDATDPYKFYSWITKDLMDFDSFPDLIQWEILSTKRTIESGSEVSIFDHYNIISVNPETEKKSLQSYINEELLKPKTFKVEVESGGVLIERTYENRLEITHEAVIASFKLPRSLDSWPESPLIFDLESTLTLPSEKSYSLVAVILYDPEKSKFSVCLDGRGIDAPWWYRLQDDSVQKVSKESVLISASKFAYMAFYMEASVAAAAKSCESPKPSQKLMMECFHKKYVHGIYKNIQRQNNNNSPTSTLKPSALPFKSKYMQTGLHSDYSLSLTGENSPPGTVRSTSVMSLPSLPSKTPRPIELGQLQDVLVPADLSNAKMQLISFKDYSMSKSHDQNVPKSDDKIDSEEIRKSETSPVEDFGLFSELVDSNSQDDVYVDYYEEIPRKSNTVSSTWAMNYLSPDLESKPLHRQGRGNLFAGLVEFDIEFPVEDSERPKSNDREASPSPKFNEEEAAELFLKASRARVQKYQLTDLDGHFNHLNIELKQLNSKKPAKQTQKLQTNQKLLARGLFYRNAAILPMSSSEESLAKTEEKDQEQQTQKKPAGSKCRYAKF